MFTVVFCDNWTSLRTAVMGVPYESAEGCCPLAEFLPFASRKSMAPPPTSTAASASKRQEEFASHGRLGFAA